MATILPEYSSPSCPIEGDDSNPHVIMPSRLPQGWDCPAGARSIIVAHGGTIELSETQPHGLTVRIFLPQMSA